MNNYEVNIKYQLPIVDDEDSDNDQLNYLVTFEKNLVTSTSLDFVSLDYDPFGIFIFTFNPNQILDVGVTIVCLTIADNDSVGMGQTRSVEACFELEVFGVNNRPSFDFAFEEQSLDWGEQATYFLPTYSDLDPLDLFQETIQMYDDSAFPPFLTFSTSQQTGAAMQLFIDPNLSDYIGMYKFKVTITDSDSQLSGEQKSAVATFGVYVRGEVPDENVEVEFDYSSLLVEENGNSELLQTGVAPTAEIISISNEGLITIYFDQKLRQEKSFPKLVEDKAIRITLLNYYDTYKPEKVLLGYSLEKYDVNFLYLKLNFTDSSLISNFAIKDKI